MISDGAPGAEKDSAFVVEAFRIDDSVCVLHLVPPGFWCEGLNLFVELETRATGYWVARGLAGFLWTDVERLDPHGRPILAWQALRGNVRIDARGNGPVRCELDLEYDAVSSEDPHWVGHVLGRVAVTPRSSGELPEVVLRYLEASRSGAPGPP